MLAWCRDTKSTSQEIKTARNYSFKFKVITFSSYSIIVLMKTIVLFTLDKNIAVGRDDLYKLLIKVKF